VALSLARQQSFTPHSSRNRYNTLWRSVKGEELADVEKLGIFRASPTGSEGKYFSETAEGAADYARQAYGTWPKEGSYTLLETSIPKEFLSEYPRIIVDGGIPTRVIPNELLPYLNPPIIHNSIPIPFRR
jgi:hypothetical protein